MDNKPFIFFLKCIVAGLIIGSVIGIIGLTHIIKEENFFLFVRTLLKLCVGLIAGIIDTLCLWALIVKPIIDRMILKSGISTKGTIDSVTSIAKPGQGNIDDMHIKARFTYNISYEANGRKITKQMPPTCLTCKEELSKVLPLEEGEQIGIRHHERFPSLSVIDNEIPIKAAKEERKQTLIHILMIPIIVTIIAVTLIILI